VTRATSPSPLDPQPSTQPRQAAILFILITVMLDVLSFGIIIPVLPGERGRESLLIGSFASGAQHLHRSGAGSMLSRMIRPMEKRTLWCLCG
jgi:hypothetical protein